MIRYNERKLFLPLIVYFQNISWLLTIKAEVLLNTKVFQSLILINNQKSCTNILNIEHLIMYPVKVQTKKKKHFLIEFVFLLNGKKIHKVHKMIAILKLKGS